SDDGPHIDALIRIAPQSLLSTMRIDQKPPGVPNLPHANRPADLPAIAQTKKRILVYTVESTWSPCPQIRLIRPFAHLADRWELIWGVKDGFLDTNAIAD